MTDTNSTKAPQDKVCGYEYTVRRGDSFYLIAHRLGIPLRDLLEANSDVNPARLMVGDVLCIPGEEDDRVVEEAPAEVPEQTPSAEEAPITEQTPTTEETPITEPETTADDMTDEEGSLDEPATPGDSMDDAMAVCPEAERYTVSGGETITDIQLNAGLNLHTLRDANPTADLSTLSAGQVLCVPKENVPCTIPNTYQMRREDTLESTALRFNVSVGALLRANPCLAPDDFRPGAVIIVPDTTQAE